jgi:hypothetical protein
MLKGFRKRFEALGERLGATDEAGVETGRLDGDRIIGSGGRAPGLFFDHLIGKKE